MGNNVKWRVKSSRNLSYVIPFVDSSNEVWGEVLTINYEL